MSISSFQGDIPNSRKTYVHPAFQCPIDCSYSSSRLDGVALHLLTTTHLRLNSTLDPRPVQLIALELLVVPLPIDLQIVDMGAVVLAVNHHWIGDERTIAITIRVDGATTLIDELMMHTYLKVE